MKKYLLIILRYLFLLILGLNLQVIYTIFTPLTTYPVFWLLKLLYSPVFLFKSTLLFDNSAIILIPACIAAAAYYLLTILSLTTPMQLQKRIKSISFLFISFLIINILRIFFFSLLYNSGSKYFDSAHIIAWHLGSTLLLLILWFVNVKIFNIKEIPLYSDFSSIYRKTKRY